MSKVAISLFPSVFPRSLVHLWLVTAVWLALVLAEDARAAGRVELTVAAERSAPLVAQQTWARELGSAGIRNVRFRQESAGDRVGIERRGTKGSPVYVVTGKLDSRGEIVLPGRRYRPGEARQIAAWLAELARLGPPESREPVGAFGFTRSQLAMVRGELAAPVDFSTRGQPRADVVRRILGRLKIPIRIDQRLLPASETDRVADELRGLASGAALACVLRPAGLGFVPTINPRGPECMVTVARGSTEVWPVGWKPEKPPGEVMPRLFDYLTINLEKVPFTKVLDALAAKLDALILVDHATIVRDRINLEKSVVTLPRRRMSYDRAIDSAAYQARLSSDLRVDEAGKAFVWITTRASR